MDNKSILKLSPARPQAAQQSIAQEAGLSDNWVPVDAPPIIPSIPQGQLDSAGKNFTASLPPAYQHDSSFVGTAYKTSNAPSHSLMPLGIQGSAITNAAIQSTSGKVVAAAPVSSGSGGGISSLTFTTPLEISVVGSPTIGSTPEIDLSWNAQPAGTEFAVPVGNVGFDGASSVSLLAASTVSVTSPVPSTNPENALYIASVLTGTFASAPAGGWTAAPRSILTSNPIYTQSVPSGSTVTATTTVTSPAGAPEAAAILLFSGATLNILQSNIGFDIGTGTVTVALPSNATSGSFILALITIGGLGGQLVPCTVNDTQSLTQNQLTYVVNQGLVGHFGTGQQAVLLSTCTNAAESVTITYPATNSGELVVYEISALNAIAVKPRFIPEAPIDFSQGVNHVPLFNGGTGANLSSTGGANKFLAQAGLGAAITVVQPDFANLSGVGKAAKYNNITTAGNGLPMIDGWFEQAGNTANIALANLITSLAASQMVRISYYVDVHRAATTSSTLPDIQFTWADIDSNVSQSVSFKNTPGTGNTTTTNFSGSFVLASVNGVAITYQLGANQAYASSGATSMAYGVHLRAEII